MYQPTDREVDTMRSALSYAKKLSGQDVPVIDYGTCYSFAKALTPAVYPADAWMEAAERWALNHPAGVMLSVGTLRTNVREVIRQWEGQPKFRAQLEAVRQRRIAENHQKLKNEVLSRRNIALTHGHQTDPKSPSGGNTGQKTAPLSQSRNEFRALLTKIKQKRQEPTQ